MTDQERTIGLVVLAVICVLAILVAIARASKKSDYADAELYPSRSRPIYAEPIPPARSKKSWSGGLWFISAVAGALWFVSYSNDQAKKEDGAKEQYLKLHPLTAKQTAANEHFYNCYNYAHASSAEMSENQRHMLLGLEQCYSDKRDDPRYDDASYPWNANAPQPWKPTATKQSAASIEGPTASQRKRIATLLAPDDAVDKSVFAKAHPANMVINGAIICSDLAMVDAVTRQMTDAITDGWVSVATGGKIDRVRPPAETPNLAAYGCAFVPAGTMLKVLDRTPVPVVEVDVDGVTIKGVTSPAMVDFGYSGSAR